MPTLPKTIFIKGNTIIGILIGLGVLSILSYTVIILSTTTYQLVGYTRARTVARNIAVTQIEMIRNMPYDEIGTQGGIPQGDLLQTQDIVENGQNYQIRRTITYVDDPFDQLTPIDTLPTDYKRVRIEISWEGVSKSNAAPVVLTTDVVPKGVESTEGGGTLSILVFNSQGLPVPQAQVHIVSNDQTNPVDLTQFTSDTGHIVLPGTPACLECYEITVTKDGFSIDKTYSNTEVDTPDKPHISVIEGNLTETSFAIDRVSSLTLNTYGSREDGFPIMVNVPIIVKGEKTIGVDVADQPVYKFSQEFVTNENGELTIENLEWDNYYISVPDQSSYSISGLSKTMPYSILPNTDDSLDISISSFTPNSLLTAFVDENKSPIASVSAILKDGNVPIATISSGLENDPDFGQAFFSDLAQKTYALEATAAGFIDFSGIVNISGQVYDLIPLTKEEL